jgi:hypothetical protein
MGYTFISYSRKQLYFAEALVLNLQRFGIETWFDLQQLTIGKDWRSRLQEGYENCEKLLLVASQAAFASPYVEVEWQTALSRGCEIILAVVEDVEIPETLQHSATFDFRIRFNRRISELAGYLNGVSAPRHDEIPRPGKFPFPLHIPIVIWMGLASQMLPFVWAVLFSLLPFPPDNFLIPVIFIFGGAFMFALFTRRFWNHDLNYQTLRNVGWIAMIVQFLMLVDELFNSIGGPFSVILSLLVFLSMVILLIFQFGILNFSGSLLRWFSAGQVTEGFRRRVHKRLLNQQGASLREDTLPEPTPLTYYLIYDPADERIARRLSNILDKIGHKPVFDYKEAQAHLVIVTNYTSHKMIRWAGDTFSDSAIYLLGSPVNSIENIGAAANSQWIDVRENDKKIMQILARGLSNLDAWQREYAFAASPKKFEAYHVPIGIETNRYFGYLNTGGLFALVLSNLYLGNLYKTILAAVCGIILLLLMDRFSTRRLPGFLSFLAIPGIPFFYFMLQFNLIIFLGGLIGSLPQLIVQVIAFVIGYRWLPSRLKAADDMLGMDSDRKIRRWGYIMIVIFFVINALLLFGVIFVTRRLPV